MFERIASRALKPFFGSFRGAQCSNNDAVFLPLFRGSEYPGARKCRTVTREASWYVAATRTNYHISREVVFAPFQTLRTMFWRLKKWWKSIRAYSFINHPYVF